jgi:hypothetical protein
MDPEVRAFYAHEYDEDARLRSQPHGVLERVRTQELLARFLPPPPARVLDVGGGTGVHAEWLATRSAIPDVRRGTRRSASVTTRPVPCRFGPTDMSPGWETAMRSWDFVMCG